MPDGPGGVSEARWASGWYVRRRHAYEMQVARPGGSVPAICSEYTGVYPNGLGNGRHAVPLADSPEVMALPACKLCLRLVSPARATSAKPGSAAPDA